jgi:hypothetical protein
VNRQQGGSILRRWSAAGILPPCCGPVTRNGSPLDRSNGFGRRYIVRFAKSNGGLMRSDLVSLGFVVTLLSASLAYGQVVIDVSKITCDQFAQGKVGQPRTTADRGKSRFPV